MAEKSIVFVGNIEGYTPLITHTLMKGYRVICTEDPENVFSFLDRENTKLIIIINTIMEDRIFASLITSDIPVVLARQDRFRHFIAETFLHQLPSESQSLEDEETVNDAVDCLLNGREEEVPESDRLVFRKQNGVMFLEPNGDRSPGKVEERIERAITYMEEHYTDQISLEQIAHAAYLSTYHFCRLFKRQAGTTCSKYLSALRIRRAKVLLAKTELPVTEICYEVGFNSLTYFGRVFKDVAGMTPSSYRRLY